VVYSHPLESPKAGWDYMTMRFARTAGLLLLLAISWPGTGILAQTASRVEDLSQLDLTFMDRQRSLLGDLAAIELGRRFSGNRDRDLDLLQTLLDKRLVRQDQTRELQAMGVVLGDLLAAEFGLHWVVYTDQVGRSRALQYGETDFVVFPVTMISRRREAGNETSVADIYAKASDMIRENTPKPPFQ